MEDAEYRTISYRSADLEVLAPTIKLWLREQMTQGWNTVMVYALGSEHHFVLQRRGRVNA